MTTPENYAAFYGLLNRMPTDDRDELKRTIVRQYTKNRTDSLREMSMQEYCTALAGMRRLLVPTFTETMEKVRRAKRSACLHQMQLMGVNTSDWDRINAFTTDPRIAGKPFARLNADELDALTVKVRMINRKKKTDDRERKCKLVKLYQK
jgi:hypothetical protein